MLIELLKNGGQGAVNGAADTVAAPVNGIADKTKYVGGNPADVPASGGWFRKQGLVKPANGLSGEFGKMLGMMAMQSAMGQKPNFARGLLGMGLGLGVGHLMKKNPNMFDRFKPQQPQPVPASGVDASSIQA